MQPGHAASCGLHAYGLAWPTRHPPATSHEPPCRLALNLLQNHCQQSQGLCGLEGLGPVHLAGLASAGEQQGLELLRRWQRRDLPSHTLLAKLYRAESSAASRDGGTGSGACRGGHSGSGAPDSSEKRRSSKDSSPSPSRHQHQRDGFQRLVQQRTTPGSLLRTALQTLQRQRPELADQLDDRNVQHLCGMDQEPALLAVHQLLLSEPTACRPGAPFPPFATDTCQKVNDFFDVCREHRIERDPQLWQRLAAGEAGSPVPLCLEAWRGPERVKHWLQVGAVCAWCCCRCLAGASVCMHVAPGCWPVHTGQPSVAGSCRSCLWRTLR